jgi:rhamnogalacturonan endolyase
MQNYVHWSRYGGTHTRNETVTDINRWTINFALDSVPPSSRNATFTMQLAGAKTTAGNTDSNQGDYPSFPVRACPCCLPRTLR